MKTRNPSHHTPWLLPPVKNAFLKEAKTVKTGTKFIIRHIAQQQVGEHSLFSYDRSKAEMHTRRARVWASSLKRRSAVKRR